MIIVQQRTAHNMVQIANMWAAMVVVEEANDTYFHVLFFHVDKQPVCMCASYTGSYAISEF